MTKTFKNCIFIIGHPGSGKGLLAKALAEKLGWAVIDADFGLEFSVGRTINEIAGSEGEQSFYKCENEILHSLFSKEKIVVITDASIVCSENNRKLLSSEFVVYLKVSTAVQIERLSRNPMPLLLISDLQNFLEKMHQERDSLYKEVATLIINGDNSELEKHVINIINNFDKEKIPDPKKLDKKDIIFFHKTLHTPVHLSEQQAACLKLLAQGKSSKEIARDMSISYRTVEGHIARMIEQLGCSSSKELIALYYDQP